MHVKRKGRFCNPKIQYSCQPTVVVGVEERQGAIAEVMPWPLKSPILKAHKIGLVPHMCRSDSTDYLHLPIFVHTSLIPPCFPV